MARPNYALIDTLLGFSICASTSEATYTSMLSYQKYTFLTVESAIWYFLASKGPACLEWLWLFESSPLKNACAIRPSFT
jgi:hypothetical protein